MHHPCHPWERSLRKHALRRSLLSRSSHGHHRRAAIGGAPPAPPSRAGTGTITGHLTDSGRRARSAAPASGPGLRTSGGRPALHADRRHRGATRLGDLDAGSTSCSFRAAGGALQPVRAPEAEVHATPTAPPSPPGPRRSSTSRRWRPAGSPARCTTRDGSATQAYISVYTAEGQNSRRQRGHRPRRHVLGWTCRPAPTRSSSPSGTAVDQWNGGQLHLRRRRPITVAAGQTTPLQETLMPTGSIAGRLTNADGSPAAGVAWVAEPAGLQRRHPSTTRPRAPTGATASTTCR